MSQESRPVDSGPFIGVDVRGVVQQPTEQMLADLARAGLTVSVVLLSKHRTTGADVNTEIDEVRLEGPDPETGRYFCSLAGGSRLELGCERGNWTYRLYPARRSPSAKGATAA